jgi:hypothetical protein
LRDRPQPNAPPSSCSGRKPEVPTPVVVERDLIVAAQVERLVELPDVGLAGLRRAVAGAVRQQHDVATGAPRQGLDGIAAFRSATPLVDLSVRSSHLDPSLA